MSQGIRRYANHLRRASSSVIAASMASGRCYRCSRPRPRRQAPRSRSDRRGAATKVSLSTRKVLVIRRFNARCFERALDCHQGTRW